MVVKLAIKYDGKIVLVFVKCFFNGFEFLLNIKKLTELEILKPIGVLCQGTQSFQFFFSNVNAQFFLQDVALSCFFQFFFQR